MGSTSWCLIAAVDVSGQAEGKLVAPWAGSSCLSEQAVSEQGACGCWVGLVQLAGDHWEPELPLKGCWARSHLFACLQRVVG